MGNVPSPARLARPMSPPFLAPSAPHLPPTYRHAHGRNGRTSARRCHSPWGSLSSTVGPGRGVAAFTCHWYNSPGWVPVLPIHRRVLALMIEECTGNANWRRGRGVFSPEHAVLCFTDGFPLRPHLVAYPPPISPHIPPSIHIAAVTVRIGNPTFQTSSGCLSVSLQQKNHTTSCACLLLSSLSQRRLPLVASDMPYFI